MNNHISYIWAYNGFYVIKIGIGHFLNYFGAFGLLLTYSYFSKYIFHLNGVKEGEDVMLANFYNIAFLDLF
jgi:hypothetical protein